VDNIPQQDSAERAFNKLRRTFAARMAALKEYRSKGEQKMTVQHVHVAEGGQAIVGNVNAPTEGEGREKKPENNLMHWPIHLALRCHAKSKRSGFQCRAPAVRGAEVYRMHGAGGGAPMRNRNASEQRSRLLLQRQDGSKPRIAKLDKYHLLILDGLAYLAKDQAETSVLFEPIGARYERRSLLITANQPFSEWGKIFSDPAMTLAAIDRLVHHPTILEMNVDSYRRKEAIEKARVGRPSTRATIKASS
jgi:hypothetical protein